MQKRLLSLSVAALSLSLMGAGCFGGGSAAKAATGGMYTSLDAGRTWVAKNTLVTLPTPSSISSTDVLSITFDPQDDTAVYLGTKANGLFYSLDGGEGWMRPEEELAKNGAVLDIAIHPTEVCTWFVLKVDRLLKTETCGRTFATETYVETRSDERLTALALDWYNPRIVWIGTSAGDVIRSVDGGATWASVFTGRDQIQDVLISNADSRIILAATARNGYIRSSDGGATWTDFEDALDAFKSSNRVTGFAQSTNGDTIVLNSDYGLLVSKDQALTWAAIPLVTPPGEVEIYDVAISPHDANVMYYGTNNTLYKSVNGGAGWTTSELPTTRATSVLAVDPAQEAQLWLGLQTIED